MEYIYAAMILHTTEQDINEENVTIDNTMLEFNEMQSNINEMDEVVDNITNKIEKVVEFNKEIEKHINTLAASSEEVTASTEEGVALSRMNKEKAMQTKTLLHNLLDKVETLA